MWAAVRQSCLRWGKSFFPFQLILLNTLPHVFSDTRFLVGTRSKQVDSHADPSLAFFFLWAFGMLTFFFCLVVIIWTLLYFLERGPRFITFPISSQGKVTFLKSFNPCYRMTVGTESQHQMNLDLVSIQEKELFPEGIYLYHQLTK